jgi:hypothetical protein
MNLPLDFSSLETQHLILRDVYWRPLSKSSTIDFPPQFRKKLGTTFVSPPKKSLELVITALRFVSLKFYPQFS